MVNIVTYFIPTTLFELPDKKVCELFFDKLQESISGHIVCQSQQPLPQRAWQRPLTLWMWKDGATCDFAGLFITMYWYCPYLCDSNFDNIAKSF